MKRNDACRLLTRIASSEIIDIQVSRELLKARDIVVCEPNKILDVLASPETRKMYKEQLIEYLRQISQNSMIDLRIRKDACDLMYILNGDGFKYKCKMYLETRCKNCPNYGGD